MSNEVENEFQLYEVVGDGWRLPITVMNRGGDTVEIDRVDGFPYLKSQRAAIESTLALFAPNVAECWYVKKSDLGKIAERSRFTNPEDVVVWRKPEAPIASEDFLKAYCEWDRAMIKNPAAAVVIWDSICRFMLHWVVNKQQPVNLGFAKLYALQARSNWKQILSGRYNGRMTGAKGCVDTADIPSSLLHDDIYRLLSATDMTAYDAKNKIVTWTLEVVPESGFFRTCQVLEEAKKTSGSNYFTKIYEQLKRQIPNAYQIFRAHILEARKPMLLLPDDQRFERRRDYLTKEQGKLIPKAAPRRITSPVVIGRSKKKSGIADVESEVALMSQMPSLQSRCPDVRDAGQDVAKPAVDGSGDGGLLVLDAVQSESGG